MSFFEVFDVEIAENYFCVGKNGLVLLFDQAASILAGAMVTKHNRIGSRTTEMKLQI